MSEKTNSSSSVRKLLRVLVAGGVALAGTAGARAEDQPGAAPTEKTDQTKQQQQPQQPQSDAQKAKAEKDQKDKDAQKKKADEQKKAADSEGGGVKGW
jgi:hypothetical protein